VTKIKALSFDKAFILVHHVELSFHSIRDEYKRWRSLLNVPYRDYSDVR